MSDDQSEILVFRTNVPNRFEVTRLTPLLNQLAGKIGRWNFDLEDSDAILRVSIPGISAEKVITAMSGAGYLCEELENIVYPPCGPRAHMRVADSADAHATSLS